jgi:hypothetical protein
MRQPCKAYSTSRHQIYTIISSEICKIKAKADYMTCSWMPPTETGVCVCVGSADQTTWGVEFSAKLLSCFHVSLKSLSSYFLVLLKSSSQCCPAGATSFWKSRSRSRISVRLRFGCLRLRILPLTHENFNIINVILDLSSLYLKFENN